MVFRPQICGPAKKVVINFYPLRDQALDMINVNKSLDNMTPNQETLLSN